MTDLTGRTDKPLLVIGGPTGSGKTDLALRLAVEFGGEVINGDSVQVYKGFDLGSAKIPEHARKGVRHHLLDILEPTQIYSAGDWAQAARRTMEDVHERGALPIIVGGTGFYIRTLLDGISPSPVRDESLRRRIKEKETARPGFMLRALKRLDPPSASRIHPNDSHKLLRALEICILARRPASRHFADAPSTPLKGWQVSKIILSPPRAALHERIALRTQRMFEEGLLQEVQGLLAQGVPSGAKAFESIGYKESLRVLAGEITEHEAIGLVTAATRQYAKRQETWFRREASSLVIKDFGDSPEVFEVCREHVRRSVCASRNY